jgi:hypothetical protein
MEDISKKSSTLTRSELVGPVRLPAHQPAAPWCCLKSWYRGGPYALDRRLIQLGAKHQQAITCGNRLAELAFVEANRGRR